MNFITSILMGALQGVAEFLPISSSGHLALFQHFFGLEDIMGNQLFFNVLLHMGTLISVCIYYRNDVLELIQEFFLGIKAIAKKDRSAPPAARRMVLMIIVATLPLFAILPIKDLVEGAMSSVTFVSITLILTGFILFFSDRLARGNKTARTSTIKDALLVGCAQALGTLPGISRSGVTISAGMALGYQRSYAVRFSFLMSLPAIFGATLLELFDAIEVGIDASLIPMYLVGMIVAGVVGYFAIGLVNSLTKKGHFGTFAFYCWAVGLGSLLASFLVK